jgi:hypothetical protein
VITKLPHAHGRAQCEARASPSGELDGSLENGDWFGMRVAKLRSHFDCERCMSTDESPFRPHLDEAKDRLKTALDEACAADVDDADTGELIRVEEVLAIANEAAKEAISVKRRLRTKSSPQADHGAVQPLSREVQNAQGVRLTVLAVRPSPTHGRANLPQRFQTGWLSFDMGRETRRIAPIPDAWESMSDEQLLALWDKAEVARRPRPDR